MSEVRHSFTFSFDETFIRRALRRDRNWRILQLVGLYAMLVPALCFLLDSWSPTILTIFGGGLIATAGMLVYAFRKAGRRMLELWQRQSPSGTIRYELDDEGYRIVLDEAQSRFLWQGLRRLWCYDDVWLIEIIKNQSAFFPPDAAGAPALDFIRERCRAAGVKT